MLFTENKFNLYYIWDNYFIISLPFFNCLTQLIFAFVPFHLILLLKYITTAVLLFAEQIKTANIFIAD